jgi:hypothetical protein
MVCNRQDKETIKLMKQCKIHRFRTTIQKNITYEI